MRKRKMYLSEFIRTHNTKFEQAPIILHDRYNKEFKFDNFKEIYEWCMLCEENNTYPNRSKAKAIEIKAWTYAEHIGYIIFIK